MKTSIFWFRRDLRLEDNIGLSFALKHSDTVLPIFIFDTEITRELSIDDARISFIYKELSKIDNKLKSYGSSLLVLKGKPIDLFPDLIEKYKIEAVYYNRDYEPYARSRENKLQKILSLKGIAFKGFKDQVIFEANDVLKKDGKPYTVFTPYKNKWLQTFMEKEGIEPGPKIASNRYIQNNFKFPELQSIGFQNSEMKVLDYSLDSLKNYESSRNFPSLNGTSLLGPHLRFGTVSIREIVNKVKDKYPVFLSELIWREFFMQILYHFPKVVSQNFRAKYDGINWRNDKDEFEKWCTGNTGYPMVDAGMRELNSTGYMHNRVRMVTASFLCKHLLIDWRWGESYFATKLLDYELSSNNGNWQWAAGSGCDAAPYFRIFNPETQATKFDSEQQYIKKWIPEINTSAYPAPVVEHKFARERAIASYKEGFLQDA